MKVARHFPISAPRVLAAERLPSYPGEGASQVCTEIVRGRKAVLELQSLLIDYSRRTGQPGAMDWLDFFVTSPDSMEKTPYVVLVGSRKRLIEFAHSRPVRAGDIHGAVLVYEYRFAGIGTHVFATDDYSGVRTVIAPQGKRIDVARAAIRALMKMGAAAALIAVDSEAGQFLQPVEKAKEPFHIAVRTRTVPRHLPLAPTYAETLAILGDDTRRNFRRYRRRAELDLGTEYVPHLQMSRDEFMEMNRRSTNPAPAEVADWRFRLLEGTSPRDGTIFSGMRGAEGQWLSLIGGRRCGQTTEIDWQMNVAGLPRYSLCTVMRSYLIEHEIARGARRLVLQGGTPHPMRFSFVSAETTDLLAERCWSPRVWALRKFSRRLFPEKNFLGAALRDFSEEPQSPAAPSESPGRLPDAA